MTCRLSDEDREALDQSLADTGCYGFLGDHSSLYAAVEALVTREVAAALERAASGTEGAVRAHRDRGNRCCAEALAPLPGLIRELGEA